MQNRVGGPLATQGSLLEISEGRSLANGAVPIVVRQHFDVA